MALRLLGSETEGTTAVSLSKGLGNAFPFTAPDTGRIDTFVYKTGSGASGTATSVRVAVMTRVSGKPGAIVGSEAVAANGADTTGSKTETKYEATGLAANVVKGTEYFLVILPIGGTVRMKGGNGEAEAGQRSSGETTTIATAGSWNEPKTFGNPVYMAGLGPITIALASVSGGGSSTASEQSVRSALATVSGGGNAIAITPSEIGVKLAKVRGAGNASASVSTKRVVTLAAVHGGGSPQAIQPVYGNAEVYGYGEASIWRVVEPLKAATPGAPIIIYLHESSHDEPSEAEAPNVLPRPGESLTESAANKRNLSCITFAENAVANGFCCFVPAYRPIGEGSVGVPGYQFSNADVDALIAWVKQHAEAWNGDPNKVCIIGGSFGVLIGMHEALKLNREKGSRYIVACAGLSGPIDIPSRVQGRDEEVAAKEAWEAAHPGFTKAELEAWEEEHNFPQTDVVSKLAKYIGVSATHLQEVGWLKGPSAEQKAALKLAEELSPYYNLATMSATMPALWYVVSKADLTPQQQGEEMNEAAAEHGQPGRYHFNPSIPTGHAFGFYSSVRSEIYAYFRQAISPSIVQTASVTGAGKPSASLSSTRKVALVTVTAGGKPAVTTQSIRPTNATVTGGGRPFALGPGLRAAITGGGNATATVSTRRSTSVTVHGGGTGSATVSPTLRITLVAGLAFGGSLNRGSNRTLSSAATFVGVGSRHFSRAFGSGLSFVGSVAEGVRVHHAVKILESAVSFSGSLSRNIGRRLISLLSFIGPTTAVVQETTLVLEEPVATVLVVEQPE